MKLARLKPAPDATEDEVALASIALERTVDVMLGRVPSYQAHSILTAANRLREEIVGSPTQRHALQGPDGGPAEFSFTLITSKDKTD